MIAQPLITVVTPTFNSAATLERTIRSVVEQDYPNIEYLIIDGGSTDETLQIARSFPRVTSIVSEKDNGIADAFNKGIQRATGQVIGIVNSDDYYEPGILKKVARWFVQSNGDEVLHGNLRYYNDQVDRILGVWPQSWIYLDLPFNHPTYFVPKGVYDSVGLYDTDYRIAMDYDWTLRAMNKAVRFHHVPRVLSHFQVGGRASSNARACHAEVLRSQTANGLSPLICRTTYAGKMFINSAKAWLPKRTGRLSGQLRAPSNEKLLTVLIPVYNAQRTLWRTLHSLSRIAYHHRDKVDILLVNDGSADDSASIIRAFVESKAFPYVGWIDQPNQGQSAARNRGLRGVSTPWVMLLDSDDELQIDPVRYIEQRPDATSLLFAVQLKQHGKDLVRIKPTHITRENHADIFTANSPFFPSGFCFRKDLLKVPFDETYGILEDWPGWLMNPGLFDDMRIFPHITSAIIHIHGWNLSAQYERRGKMRVQIAQDLLHRLAKRLTEKQRNNLILQQRIGQLQLGEAIPSSTFFKVPVDPVLYVKLWIYSLFKDRLGKLEPYGAAARALEQDAASL